MPPRHEAEQEIISRKKAQKHTYRIYAARGLAHHGKAAQMAIPALSNALNDSNAEVRDAALDALTNIVSAVRGGQH